METQEAPEGVEVLAPVSDEASAILTPEALRFIKGLHKDFSETRKMLLQRRKERQTKIDSGVLPDFPRGIEALSGADVYMADLEDSLSPTWSQLMQGQVNLADAVRRTISFDSPEGKHYALNEKVATLVVRPRGIHLLEEHVRVDGEPVSATLFDFGVFFHHNARELRTRRSNPYFYIPKMESGLEARFWDRLFTKAEEYLVIPRGSIRATALIETLPASFEIEEILYNLRDHIVGLNCGRWDYIFSYIKKLRNHPQFVLPDRAQVTMDRAFLAAYVDQLIKCCHRRGAYAIGGMSAYIPVRSDEAANALAFQKVRADKEREVRLGHDGTWVAHPGLVALAREVFEAGFKGPNQLGVLREDVNVTAADLLRVPEGQITEAGVRADISVALQYLGSWLSGTGCVPINNLMEDAATAEISRAQLWQWVRHGASLSDGRKVTIEMVRAMMAEEVARLTKGPEASPAAPSPPSSAPRIALAAKLLERLVAAPEFVEFLTLPAYQELLDLERGERAA
ncbi:MAG: malate synthase A [Nitrososphaerales archaeon]